MDSEGEKARYFYRGRKQTNIKCTHVLYCECTVQSVHENTPANPHDAVKAPGTVCGWKSCSDEGLMLLLLCCMLFCYRAYSLIVK